MRQLYPWGDWQLLSTYRGTPDWRLFGDGLRVENEPFFKFCRRGYYFANKKRALVFRYACGGDAGGVFFFSRDSPHFPRFPYDGGGGECGLGYSSKSCLFLVLQRLPARRHLFFPSKLGNPLFFLSRRQRHRGGSAEKGGGKRGTEGHSFETA